MMKGFKICAWTGLCIFILLTSACILGNVTVTILQTSDIHHHASGYGPFNDFTPLSTNDDAVLGGYSRLASAINKVRKEQAAKGIPVLLFDSGDYFMGTVYDMSAGDTTYGPAALKFFSLMKYDAVTLGNHEFDWADDGLALLLNAGIYSPEGKFNVPVVASNMVLPTTEVSPLQALVDSGKIVNKKIIRLPYGVKFGIIGLMGPNAHQDAPAAKPVTFDHTYPYIQTLVDRLRNDDCVQVVIALSHGGIDVPADGSSAPTGDDVDLANNVTGIDMICSGHYHTATPSAYVVGPSKTIVYEPGSYGRHLARIDVTYNYFLGRIVDYKYTLIPIDDTVKGDPGIQAMVDGYNAGLSQKLDDNGLPGLADPITTTAFNLEEEAFQVTGIGSLAADSLRAVANSIANLSGGDPFDIAIVPSGVIRDSIYPGSTGVVTFSDAYNALPLGISPYDPSVPGYPLMSVYATGADIKAICEVGLTLSHMLGSDYYLNFSGLKIALDHATGRVSEVYAYAPSDTFCLGAATEIDPDAEYHIVVDYYAFQMLSVVNSYIAMFNQMYDPDIPYINPQNPTRIDRDPSTPSIVEELKEWTALVMFLPELGGSIPAQIYGPAGACMGRVY